MSINDELRDKLEEVLASGISTEAVSSLKKRISDITTEVEDDIMYRLKDELAPNLASYVEGMANRVVSSILRGNEGRCGSTFLVKKVAVPAEVWTETTKETLRRNILLFTADFLKTMLSLCAVKCSMRIGI